MNKNYNFLIENVRNRLNPDAIHLKKSFTDELSTISYSDVLTFIRYAMKGVEPEYTQKSKDAGKRVQEHLSSELSSVTYKYQGSVMTDTHIKGHSDIDLLTISEKFYQIDRQEIKSILENTSRKQQFYSNSISKIEQEYHTDFYEGNALEDLRRNRMDSERILKGIYIICETNKPKSIKIKNLNLNREVDIVIANWYDDVTSVINNKGEFRGIQIYNKETHSRENPDYPFLSIERINRRSAQTMGRLKKMIRFIKNIKAVSDPDMSLSSFDINAICYDIKTHKYENLKFYELVPVIFNQIKSLCENKRHADDLVSVDGREYIFRYNSQKLEDLKIIYQEVRAIYLDLHQNIL